MRLQKGVIAGWVLSVLPAAFLLSGAVTAWLRLPQTLQGITHLGYPVGFPPIAGFLEFICATLFLIPRTAFFGAILMTAYFGGATASHVRIGETLWIVPVIFGVVIWTGLLLRDARLRAYCFAVAD